MHTKINKYEIWCRDGKSNCDVRMCEVDADSAMQAGMNILKSGDKLSADIMKTGQFLVMPKDIEEHAYVYMKDDFGNWTAVRI